MSSLSTTAPEGEVIDLPVAIGREEVLHFLGYPEGQGPSKRMEGLMDAAISEARTLASARGAFVTREVDSSRDLGLEPIAASGLVVGLVTIGSELDRRVDDLVAREEPTRALLVDAAGSAAVEEAADRLGAIVAGEGTEPTEHKAAAHVSCRVSPGYGAWPITAQAELFEVLPHQKLGVRLLSTMLMTPRKSISFAMWLGAEGRPMAGLSGCARCALIECRYRRKEGAEHS